MTAELRSETESTLQTMKKLFIMLLLAAFTLSVGLPLLEAAPAKAKQAQVAKGKTSKKGKAQKKAQKKKQKKQNKGKNTQKRQQKSKQPKKNSKKRS
jgi:hypothetical protein